MAGDQQTIGFQADDDLQHRIETYQTTRGFDNRSNAARQLVELGLREENGPMLHELRSSVSTVAFAYACGALAMLILGVSTTIVTVQDALSAAFTFVVVAIALVGAVELARTVKCQNELGATLLQGRF